MNARRDVMRETTRETMTTRAVESLFCFRLSSRRSTARAQSRSNDATRESRD